MARDGVLLLAQRAVALVALALVRGQLGLPVRQRVLQPLQLAHLHLDRLGALLVLDGEVLEVLRALLGRGHVVGVRGVEVPLKLLNEPLECEAQHVILLRVLALDLFAVRVELLPRLALLLVELGLHQRHDVEHLLLVLGVPRQNLARLCAKLLDELLQVPLELKLDAPARRGGRGVRGVRGGRVRKGWQRRQSGQRVERVAGEGGEAAAWARLILALCRSISRSTTSKCERSAIWYCSSESSRSRSSIWCVVRGACGARCVVRGAWCV